MPIDCKYHNFFVQKFRKMAETVSMTQQPEGYWTRSIMDAEFAPGAETSGTALFAYGLIWGVNNGFLDQSKYLPVIKKAWNYLENVSLQTEGSIGYVQPIGSKAIPGQVLKATSTANFGTGVFLLAACEYVRLLENK